MRVKKNVNFKQNNALVSVYTATKPLYKTAYLFAAKSVCIIGASSKNADNPGTVIANKYFSIYFIYKSFTFTDILQLRQSPVTNVWKKRYNAGLF